MFANWLKSKRKVIFSVTSSLTYALFARAILYNASNLHLYLQSPSPIPSFLPTLSLSNCEKLVCFRCTCIRFQQIIHVLHSTSAWNLSKGKIIEIVARVRESEKERREWVKAAHTNTPERINEQANNSLLITRCSFNVRENVPETVMKRTDENSITQRVCWML